MESVAQKKISDIPEVLLYETVDHKPVYYKGYRDFLNGNKQLEELMGSDVSPSSYMQSLIINRLVKLLLSKLENKYEVLFSELGLQFPKGTTRSVDIAVISKEKLQGINRQDQYLGIPPDMVIEVDIKADTEGDSMKYINQKTEDLLAFGVKKVIWILSNTSKVLLAQEGKAWEIISWDQELSLMDDLEVNIQKLIHD